MSDTPVAAAPVDETAPEAATVEEGKMNTKDFATKFSQKMIYNILHSMIDDDYAFASFFRSIRSHGRDIMPPEIFDYVNKCEKKFRKANPDIDYVIMSQYLMPHTRKKMVSLIAKHIPSVKQTYKVPKNITYFSKLLDFDKTESNIFYFGSMIDSMEYNQRNIFESLRYSFGDPVSFYTAALGISRDKISKIFSMKTNLLTSGIMVITEKSDFNGHYEVMPKMSDLLSDSDLTDEKLIQILFPSTLESTLDIDDYEHKQSDISILADVINTALKNGTHGINALFWGLPGTGKTELTLLMAKLYGWDLRVIGDMDENSDEEKGRQERLLSLKLAQKLFKHTSKIKKNIVLLFDEMEDLFKLDLNANFSKAFINRTIEKTHTPIIWTTNSLDALGDAVIRRMTFVIEFDTPGFKARRKIWNKCNMRYNLDMTVEEIEHLAVTYDVVPALIANTCNVAHLSGIKADTMARVIENLDTAMNYGNKRKHQFDSHDVKEYRTSLSNADISLDDMVENITNKGIHHFSICAYGPSGTGKSAFGRYMANRMDKRVMFKRASDIQSMWVGKCEKNMAKMFKESKEDERFLILDEADSFLRDRSNAKQSWEASQTNEMLTQMETHDQPFFCTTNLIDTMDAAALRRFTFKIKFDFLKPSQLADAFQFFFGVGAPRSLDKYHILTSGDFANVKTKVDILGITGANEILDFLIAECELKPQFTKTIGFEGNRPTAATTIPFHDEDRIAAEKSMKMKTKEGEYND